MGSRPLVLAALLLTIQGCNFDEETKSYTIGDIPDVFSTGYMWGQDDDTVAMIDLEGKTIQRFTVEPFRHVHSLDLPLAHSSQGLIASPAGSYYVTIGSNEKGTVVAIVKEDGSAIKDPVLLTGDMRGAAYDPLEHLLVLTDDLGTLAFLQLDKKGSILDSCKAGSSFSSDGRVVSGAMLGKGILALAIGESTLAFVDVKATLANRCESVDHRSVTVSGATDMRFVAASPNDDEHVMILDASRLVLVKKADGTTAQTFDMTGKTVSKVSRYRAPHLILTSTLIGTDRDYDLVYLAEDDTFKTRTFRMKDQAIRQSILDLDKGMLTVELVSDEDLDDYYTEREIYRLRVSDQLVIDRTSIESEIYAVLTRDYVVGLYRSALGHVTRSGYGPKAKTETLEGYNLDVLRKRFKEDKED